MYIFSEWLKKTKLNETKLNESGFARIRQMLVGDVDSVDEIGIITSANPNAQRISEKENDRRMEDLEKDLRGMGYGPVRVSGSYGAPEPSFVVPHISKQELLELGKNYGQHSIIHGRKIKDRHNNDVMRFEMIRCEDDGIESTRIVSLSGEDVQSRDDYFTKVKNRKFVIPFYDNPQAKTLFGKTKGKLDTFSKANDPEQLHMGIEDVEPDPRQDD
jgi:hypothetical protein